MWGLREINNHIIREWNKLEQEYYKINHDWVRKVIQWELCKKLKFDYAQTTIRLAEWDT